MILPFYQFSGIPVTLRELEEKMSRDVTSLDHFKHMAKVMAERMVASVKGKIFYCLEHIFFVDDNFYKGTSKVLFY